MGEIVIGVDPGGKNKTGVALIFMESYKIVDIKVSLQTSVNEVLQWIDNHIIRYEEVVAIGIDSFLTWSTDIACWRPVDKYLRKKYKPVRNSVLSINSAQGSMVAQGIMIIDKLSEKCPHSTLINETHPKVAYFAESNNKYDSIGNVPSNVMHTFLNNKVLYFNGANTPYPSSCTCDEWDALYSAIFTLEYGIYKKVKRDLLNIKSNSYAYWPLGSREVYYYWISCTRWVQYSKNFRKYKFKSKNLCNKI